LTCLSALNDDVILWHKRLGHGILSLLNKLVYKDLVVRLPSIKYNDNKVCNACARGKQVRTSFKIKNYVSTFQPLELLHVNFYEPMRITSRGGKMYVLVIIDDYSCFTWTLFWHRKMNLLISFLCFLRESRTLIGLSQV